MILNNGLYTVTYHLSCSDTMYLYFVELSSCTTSGGEQSKPQSKHYTFSLPIAICGFLHCREDDSSSDQCYRLKVSSYSIQVGTQKGRTI